MGAKKKEIRERISCQIWMKKIQIIKKPDNFFFCQIFFALPFFAPKKSKNFEERRRQWIKKIGLNFFFAKPCFCGPDHASEK
jgi:hypothetical protein